MKNKELHIKAIKCTVCILFGIILIAAYFLGNYPLETSK